MIVNMISWCIPKNEHAARTANSGAATSADLKQHRENAHSMDLNDAIGMKSKSQRTQEKAP